MFLKLLYFLELFYQFLRFLEKKLVCLKFSYICRYIYIYIEAINVMGKLGDGTGSKLREFHFLVSLVEKW